MVITEFKVGYLALSNADAIIEDPSGSNPPISAGEFLIQRVSTSYGGKY